MLYIIVYIVIPILIVGIAYTASVRNSRAVQRTRDELRRRQTVADRDGGRVRVSSFLDRSARSKVKSTSRDEVTFVRSIRNAPEGDSETWLPPIAASFADDDEDRPAAAPSGGKKEEMRVAAFRVAPVAAAAAVRAAAPLANPGKGSRVVRRGADKSTGRFEPDLGPFPNLLSVQVIGATPDIAAIAREAKVAPLEVIRESKIGEPVWRAVLMHLASSGTEGINYARVIELALIAEGKIAGPEVRP
ncbi:hypothetical protein [Neotabrizicola sp. sgz301269]|uniref:hypothetical protein n=1 Tax=Neotabrizicola sp. sgz301269 TaxID=3276282 RepID=UPI00376FF4B0